MEKETTQLLLRIPVDLKAELQRHADNQGRKLTQEINIRLRNSLPARGPTMQKWLAKDLNPPEGEASGIAPITYPIGHQPAANHTGEMDASAPTLSDLDRHMLQVFHAMPVEKQLALLSLFK